MADKLTDSLTIEQKTAILAYFDAHGRTWKSQLNLDWESACARLYPEEHRSTLQRLRNTLGPQWLHKFRLDATTIAAWRAELPEPTPLGTPEPEALVAMRARGGTWAAYQNVDLGHTEQGHLRFLQFGEGCTFTEAPARCLDTNLGPGWRYVLIGTVNLETGLIEKGPNHG